MKIISVNISSLPEVNLGPIKMERLGQMVVIAGQNGAGKSRLLNHLASFNSQFQPLQGIEQQIEHYRQAIDKRAAASKKASDRQVVAFRTSLEKLEKQLDLMRSIAFDDDSKPVIVPFVPTKLDISDSSGMAPKNLISASQNVQKQGIGHLAAGAFARIQHFQNRHREATHQNADVGADACVAAIEEYARLQAIIEQFLHTKVTRSIEGEAQLFGLPLGKTALSDGQKVILQLCIAIHGQGASLNDLIIFMDEPENHLHPAALLDWIQMMRSRIGDGQLWIATHSIPLLAEVDPSSIWWMEDNTISKAGRKPETVLTGLLGDESRRSRLAAFLDLPFALGSNRFAAECLLPPQPFDTFRKTHKQNRSPAFLNSCALTCPLMDCGSLILGQEEVDSHQSWLKLGRLMNGLI